MKAATFGAAYPASVCQDHSTPEITSKVPLCRARNRFTRKLVHEKSIVYRLIDRKCEKRESRQFAILRSCRLFAERRSKRRQRNVVYRWWRAPSFGFSTWIFDGKCRESKARKRSGKRLEENQRWTFFSTTSSYIAFAELRNIKKIKKIRKWHIL